MLFMLLQIVLNAVQQDKQPLGSAKELKKNVMTKFLSAF